MTVVWDTEYEPREELEIVEALVDDCPTGYSVKLELDINSIDDGLLAEALVGCKILVEIDSS